MDFNIVRWIANRRELETEETDISPIEETDSCSDFGLLSCSDFGLDETDETVSCTSSEEKSVFVGFDLLELDVELLDEVEETNDGGDGLSNTCATLEGQKRKEDLLGLE